MGFRQLNVSSCTKLASYLGAARLPTADQDRMLTKHAMKRKQPSSASARKAQQTGRQTKLTHHSFGASEQCPHCPQRFSSLQQLIDHVESAHLNDAISSAPDNELCSTHQEAHLTEPLEENITAEQHEKHQAQQQQQQQPTLQLQQHKAVSEQQQQLPQQQQQQRTWWTQRPADPVVAHIRYTSSSSGSQPLQPVRLSALSSVAPVELLLQALPPPLANSLLTELLGQSEAWVAGSWWFEGQQQTAPRSSANYILQAQVRLLGMDCCHLCPFVLFECQLLTAVGLQGV
jgi:hypothetical protein